MGDPRSSLSRRERDGVRGARGYSSEMRASRAFLAALFLMASGTAVPGGDGKTDVAYTWVLQNYDWMINHVMPLPKVTPHDEWVFSIRVTPTWEQEYLVSVRRTFARETSLTLVCADGDDLVKQAEAIVSAHPGISRQKVLGKLRVRRRQLDESCAGLPELADSVEKLPIPTLPRGDLVVDGVGYEFLSSTNWSGEVSGEFSSGTDSMSGVADWARRARDVAENCSAAPKTTPPSP
jgi:hypothetical protein